MKTKTLIKTATAAATATVLSLLMACSPGSQQAGQAFQQATENTNSNIVGGSDSTPDFQKENGIVAILMIYQTPDGKSPEALCTGSLIAEKVVLTAAHCLGSTKAMTLKNAFVLFGTDVSEISKEFEANDFSHVRPAAKVMINNKWVESNTTVNNDLALLEFAGDLPEGFKLARRATAEQAAALTKGTKATFSGFGTSDYTVDFKTGQFSGKGDGKLRQVSDIPMIETLFAGKEIAFDQSSGNAGACHGDSGGPAYIVDAATGKNILIGVTSRGAEENGKCKGDIIYTSVAGYADWIDAGITRLKQVTVPTPPSKVAGNEFR